MRRKKRKKTPLRPAAPRRRAGRRAVSAFVIVIVLLSAAAAVLYLARLVRPLFRMPVVEVGRVRIESGGPLNSMDILRKAGIRRNTDIMALDLSKIKKDLPQKEPYIKEAVVIRNPASAGLDIILRLRTPGAFVNAQGVLFAVDGAGFVIGDIEKVDFMDLPVITGLDIERPVPGDSLSGEKISAALRVLEHSLGSGLAAVAPISEINMSDIRHIVLYAGDDGMQIRLRYGTDLEEKAKEAAAIAAYLRQKGEKAEYIDLRFRRTVVKPRENSN